MKNKLLKAILLGTGISVLIALPVLAYTYRAPFTITENASNSYTMLPIMVASKNSFMASNGFMQSNAMDTRVETLAGTAKPHMVVNNMTLTAIPVSANSQTNLFFTSGSSNLSNMSIITGYGGNFTTLDNDGLELGGNFTVNQTGWVDTTVGANKTLVYKPGAITTNITGAGNITTTIPLASTPTSNISPDGSGASTNLSLTGAATNWQAVLTNDGTTSYVSNAAGANYSLDLYTAGNLSAYRGLTITKLELFAVSRQSNGSTDHEKGYLRIGATNYAGNVSTVSGATFVTYSLGNWTSNPSTNQTWSVSDLDALQIGIALSHDGAGGETQCTQLYATITFTSALSVTATGVTSGNHTVATTFLSPSGNMSIIVDGVVKDTFSLNGTLLVQNTVNDWLFCVSNTTAWTTNLTITINSTQVLWYSPNDMIQGTVLPNRASSSNNATINYGVNPVGINATLGSMTSTGQPTIGQVADPNPQQVLPQMRVSNNNVNNNVPAQLLTNPIRPFILMITGNGTGSITEIQAWRLFGFAIVIIALFWSARMSKGNLLLTGIVTGAAIGAMIALYIWPFWTILFAIISVVAGFLAQTELGTNKGQG